MLAGPSSALAVAREDTLLGDALSPALDDVAAVMDAAVQALAGPILGPMVREHLHTGGKLLRARLALAAASALGAPAALAVRWAASCELMHNATLVHDDIQDGDTTRRGKPSVWARHGIPQAINVGDLLLMLPYHLVASAPFPLELRGPLGAQLSQSMAQVIVGQGQECAMTLSHVSTPEDYRAMVRGKTAALFELPVMGAALLAGNSVAQGQALTRGFAPLGVLFQLQDDVVDLYGNKGRGVLGSDLYEGKMSALVVEHLCLRPNDAPWLLTLLAKAREATSADEVDDARKKFVESGALLRVLRTIADNAERAQQVCDARLVPLLNELMARIVAPLLPIARAHRLDVPWPREVV